MTSARSRVSVLIPTFNPGAEIRSAVASVLSQDGVDVAIHVLDDGSYADPERHLGDLLADRRLTYRRSSHNRGAAATWNELVASADAPYVKILPQDDLLAPGSLRSQVDALQRSGAVMAAGRRRLMSSRGRIFGPRLGLSGLIGLHERPDVVGAALRIGGNPVGEPGSWLVDREVAGLVQFRPDAGYAIDIAYIFDLLHHGPLAGIDAVQTYFRVSNTAWTSRLEANQIDDFLNVVAGANKESLLDHPSTRNVIRVARRRSWLRKMIYRVAGGSRLGSLGSSADQEGRSSLQ